MKPIEQKNLEHLNLRVTILGYPLILGLFIIIALFLVNLFGIAFSKTIFLKILTIIFDITFCIITYLNFKRIKRKELSLFSYLTLNKLPQVAYDDERILNYFINERNQHKGDYSD